MNIDLQAFTAFDLLVAAVVGLSALVALVRGFVREALGLLSWLGAAAVTYYGFSAVRPLVKEAVGHDLVTDAATFLAVFVAPLIAFKLLAGALAERLRGGAAGLVDRLLGLVFGGLRGAFLVVVGYLAVVVVLEPQEMPPWVARAVTHPPVEQAASRLAELLPEGLAAQLRAGSRQAVERARELRGGPAYGEESNRSFERLLEEMERP